MWEVAGILKYKLLFMGTIDAADVFHEGQLFKIQTEGFLFIWR